MGRPQFSIESNTQLFGRRLQLIRERIGFSCDELAQRSGVNPNYIRSIERGGRDLSLSTIAALAEGLNLPVLELVDAQPLRLSQIGQLVGHLFEEAPSDMQAGVAGILRSAQRMSSAPGRPTGSSNSSKSNEAAVPGQ